MNNQKIRVGVIGAGDNTRKLHIPLLQAIEGVEVVAIANRSVASARAAAAPFGIRTATDQWQTLIEDPDINAICIGTWPYLHAPVTLAALAAGKHVLCEARMACNAHEAREMLAAAEVHPDLVAQLVPAPFTLRLDSSIRDLIDQGAIGTLLAVEAAYSSGTFRAPDAPMSWRQDERLSGHNALTLGIRYEALMRWIGPAARIAAVSLISVPSRLDPQGERRTVQIPDHLDIIGKTASGASLNMRLSAITGHSPHDETRLYGSEATLVVSGSPARALIARAGETDFHPIAPAPLPQGALDNGWRVERDFIDAIRGIAPITRTTFADGVRYMEFTDAVHCSAAENRFVEIPDI